MKLIKKTKSISKFCNPDHDYKKKAKGGYMKKKNLDRKKVMEDMENRSCKDFRE